jgi:hypothetical protein
MSYQTKYLKYKEKYLKLKKEQENKEGGAATGVGEVIALGTFVAFVAGVSATLIATKRAFNCPIGSTFDEGEKKRNPLRKDLRETVKRLIRNDKDGSFIAALQPIINKLTIDYNKNKETILNNLKSNPEKQYLSKNIKIYEIKNALQNFQTSSFKKFIGARTRGTLLDSRDQSQKDVDNIISSIDCLCNPSSFKTFSVVGQVGNIIVNTGVKTIYLGHVPIANQRELKLTMFQLLNIVNQKFKNINTIYNSEIMLNEPFNSVLLYEHGRLVSKVLANFLNLDKYTMKDDKEQTQISEEENIDKIDNKSTIGGNQEGGNLYKNKYGKYIFFYNSFNVKIAKDTFSGGTYWTIPLPTNNMEYYKAKILSINGDINITNKKEELSKIIDPRVFIQEYNITSNKLAWITSGREKEGEKEEKQIFSLSLDQLTDQIGDDKQNINNAWYYYLDNINNPLSKNIDNIRYMRNFSEDNSKKITDYINYSPTDQKNVKMIDNVEFLKNSILELVNPDLFGEFMYINCFVDLIPKYSDENDKYSSENKKYIEDTEGVLNVDNIIINGNKCNFKVKGYKLNNDDTLEILLKEDKPFCIKPKS